MKYLFDTGEGKLYLRDDGILYDQCEAGVIVASQARQTVDLIGAYANEHGKQRLIVDIRRVKSVAREAREIYSSEESSNHHIALALIVGSPLSRIVGNFMVGLNKMHCPTKLFSDIDQAAAWLKEFKDES